VTQHRALARRRLAAFVLALSLGVAPQVLAEPSAAALAKDPKLFLETASESLHWKEPAEPVKIVGPIYFVGTAGLSAWLITTSRGHILLNTGMPGSGPMIEASIRKLGFKPEDVKILIACHAHIDHVGALGYMKKATGAQVAIMDKEMNLLRSGGRTDFHYGKVAAFTFPQVAADRTLHDGDTIKLGKIKMTARLTPGHTKGATTWTTTVTEHGKKYVVVFPDGTSINPGYRVGKNPSYPGIADDYRHTLEVLESLHPDIWLGAHTDAFDFEAKCLRAVKEGAAAWVDPDGYKAWLARQRENFEAALAADAAPAAPTK
jgi:metallo-beta-lactamase class B